MWWIFAALLLLPTCFSMIGLPDIAVIMLSGICGLAGCIMPRKLTGFHKIQPHGIVSILLTAVAISVLSALVTGAWKALLTWCEVKYPEKQLLAEMISLFSGWKRAGLFVSLCMITPVLEEFLFRRMIYPVWYKLHPETAFAGTAVLFSVVHGFLPGLPGLFILGCGFQYLYLRYRNLSAPVLAHALVNTIAFAVNCVR